MRMSDGVSPFGKAVDSLVFVNIDKKLLIAAN